MIEDSFLTMQHETIENHVATGRSGTDNGLGSGENARPTAERPPHAPCVTSLEH
jgi:hypothetical protein